MIDILSEAMSEKEFSIACRRYLHENPELSDLEDNTVRFVMEKLGEMGVSCVEVPGGGVMGVIDGREKGKHLVLRADMDALAIAESEINEGGFPKACISRVEGVSHACGHDCHTAMLLASAAILQRNRDSFCGRVYLYFERGEECGNGDRYMIEYIEQNQLHIDGAWALHVSPNYPAGTLAFAAGGVYAAGIGWSLRLDKNENTLLPPAVAMAEIIRSLEGIRHRVFSPFKALTVSPGKLVADEDSCRISGTCRFLEREDIGVPMQKELKIVLEELATLYGYSADSVRVSNPGIPVFNHPECVELACSAVKKALGEEYLAKGAPTMGSESFRVLAKRYPSVIGHLGIENKELGMTGGLHNPRFEPCEDALPYGVAATVSYALEFFSREEDFSPWKA